MSHILVIRLSAFGDVAMTVPVIHSLAVCYPQHRITVLSRGTWAPLFARLPHNVHFMGVDFRGEYRGLSGLNALFSRLKAMRFDLVADLHSVLRTRYLSLRFRLAGVPVCSIDKGRAEKKKLVNRMPKDYTPLTTSFERYRQVFARLGLPFELRFRSLFGDGKGRADQLPAWLTARLSPAAGSWASPGSTANASFPSLIGIAPFAAHPGKVYPFPKMEEVIATLCAEGDVRICLFGGKSEAEQQLFARWEERFPGVVSVAGRLKLDEELVLMSLLDGMVSMDSSNMHLASLVATPVISVWGATHPCAGFMGWNQSETNVVQTDLSCRPCSIYGNKPCHRGDYACLHGIAPRLIVEKIAALKR